MCLVEDYLQQKVFYCENCHMSDAIYNEQKQ